MVAMAVLFCIIVVVILVLLVLLFRDHASKRSYYRCFLPHAVNCGRFCFWRRQSAVSFWFVYEISLEPLNGFAQILTEDVFGPSFGRVGRPRSTVKVTVNRNGIFRPFRRPACCLYGERGTAPHNTSPQRSLPLEFQSDYRLRH